MHRPAIFGVDEPSGRLRRCAATADAGQVPSPLSQGVFRNRRIELDRGTRQLDARRQRGADPAALRRNPAIAALIDRGETVEAIAARFEVSKRHVRQRLRLGKLAPQNTIAKTASEATATNNRIAPARRRGAVPTSVTRLCRRSSSRRKLRPISGAAINPVSAITQNRSAVLDAPPSASTSANRRRRQRDPDPGSFAVAARGLHRSKISVAAAAKKPLQKSGAASLARGLQRAPVAADTNPPAG